MSDSFEPNESNQRALRDALGQFGTGITVITCDSAFGPLGITANSFASVSLDPALVLWSPAKVSRRYEAFAQAQNFAVHILSQKQSDICQGFSKDAEAFEGFDWRANEHRVPLISGSLACFECTQEAVHDAGDHSIVIGRVARVTTQAGKPLMFHSGKYGRFVAD
ncbi:flavin reductase family protein [Planktotalea sp.]|uniref:flavin reductase family protein n=1 Tax=Planktotalea sp. TaxID=2029877 RepID=UPI003D6B4484